MNKDIESELKEIFSYYCKYSKRLDQSELIEMLREIQEVCGGVISATALQSVCDELGVKDNYISTVIKFCPDIKTERVSHRLSVCGGVNCKNNGSSELGEYIRKTYGVKPGGICEKYGFSYEICGCIKQCASGPNIKWDGKVYSKVTTKMLDKLIKAKE